VQLPQNSGADGTDARDRSPVFAARRTESAVLGLLWWVSGASSTLMSLAPRVLEW
jgi:hypothetical protein